MKNKRIRIYLAGPNLTYAQRLRVAGEILRVLERREREKKGGGK